MEPHIRYARAADGVSIAYSLAGAGPPLLLSPQGMISDIVGQYRVPEIRRWFELLAQRYAVLMYDYRGFGSSQREVPAVSLDTMILDINAVVSAAGFQRFTIFGAMINGAIACVYAHRFPNRVSHLILWSAGWGGPRIEAQRIGKALDEIAASDWNLYARLRMQAAWGWSMEQARAYARLLLESTTADTYLTTVGAWKQIEIEDILPAIRAETLVVRSDSRSVPNPGGSERIASAVPGARMVSLHGPDYLPWMSEAASTEAMGIIAEFLDGVRRDVTSQQTESALAAGTAVILFADVADSTALTERLGDMAFRARARELDAALRAAVREHGGGVIDAKTLGDGILATFPAAAQAVRAAVACASAGEAHDLPLHVGLHAGDVIREAGNVFGGAVNIAARVSALAAPGEVLVSDIVRGLARTSAGVVFEDRGEHALKGVADAVRVYAVRSED